MKHIIFDFDGTLVDSFDEAIRIFNILALSYHFRQIEQHEIPRLKDLTTKEFIKHLKLPLYKIPRVLLSARKMIRETMSELLPAPNIKTVLRQLHETGCTLGILTSNAIENVAFWLQQHDIADLFSYIDNESSLFGKSGKIKKLMKSRQLTCHDTFYIGDETRDIDAAKHCKITSIAVTWGFNSEKVLRHSQPDYLVSKAEELLDIFSLQ